MADLKPTPSAPPNKSGASQPAETVPAPGVAYPHSAVMAAPASGIVVVQPAPSAIMVASPMMVAPNPQPMICPNCQQHIVTSIHYENGMLTYIAVGFCICFGCVFGCCLIPCCTPGCQDVLHTCPNCNRFIGRYNRV